MVYYILIYWIKQYVLKYVPQILALTGIVALLVYVLWFPYKYETGSKGMYGITTQFRWIPYFAFMLFGSWMGLKHKTLRFRPIIDFCMMTFCLAVFYGILLAAKKTLIVTPYQIVTLLPLMGIVFYFYKWCHAEFWRKLYTNKSGHTVIMTISGLCLESYLIQYSVFTTKINSIFPFNLPIMVIVVLVVAFICKVLSRLFSQTFGDKDYEWKEIIKLY